MPDPFIYVMVRGGGLRKVGYSCNPRVRCRTLRSIYRMSLTVERLWSSPMAFMIEGIVHRNLAPHRATTPDGMELYEAPSDVICAAVEAAIVEAGTYAEPVSVWPTRRTARGDYPDTPTGRYLAATMAWQLIRLERPDRNMADMPAPIPPWWTHDQVAEENKRRMKAIKEKRGEAAMMLAGLLREPEDDPNNDQD